MQNTGDKSACVLCNGCPELRHDAATMQELLRSEGWKITGDVGRADLIVLSACGAVPHSQRHSLHLARQLTRRKRPHAELVVCGCMSSIQPGLLRQVYNGPTCGPDDFARFAEIVGAAPRAIRRPVHHTVAGMPHWDPPELLKPLSRWPGVRRIGRWLSTRHRSSMRPVDPPSCSVKVASGCLHRCSFCAIRLARGRVRSRPIEDVAAEVEACLLEGHREILLLATDLGAYGRDLGVSLPALLERLLRIPGVFLLGLRNVQPRHLFDMIPSLQDILRTGRISFVLSGALSGSNRILELMKRGYRIEQFREAVAAVKKLSPRTQIAAQMIVGFPGETEQEFEESLRLVRDAPIDACVPYAFEATPGTEAAEMPDPVPRQVVKRRYRQLAGIARRLGSDRPNHAAAARAQAAP